MKLKLGYGVLKVQGPQLKSFVHMHYPAVNSSFSIGILFFW